MTPFDQRPVVRILQELGQGLEPAAAVIRRNGMSPKSFLTACNEVGGLQVLAAKEYLYQAFQRRLAQSRQGDH